MDKKDIAKIINLWDPIDLLSHAPKDEYDDEIVLILESLRKSDDPVHIAESIRKIFKDRFGDDIFKEDYQKCLQIADNLLSKKRSGV